MEYGNEPRTIHRIELKENTFRSTNAILTDWLTIFTPVRIFAQVQQNGNKEYKSIVCRFDHFIGPWPINSSYKLKRLLHRFWNVLCQSEMPAQTITFIIQMFFGCVGVLLKKKIEPELQKRGKKWFHQMQEISVTVKWWQAHISHMILWYCPARKTTYD